MVKCHLCLVTLTGHMQECMVILIKRPVNDRGGSEKFLTLTMYTVYRICRKLMITVTVVNLPDTDCPLPWF